VSPPSWVCCFCAGSIDRNEDAVELAFSSLRQADDPAVQGVAAHAQCLAERLHPTVPFSPEIFGKQG
jgi:hypothetical protein